MTRDKLYIFLGQILGGYQLDTTLFYMFLDIAQMRRENMRPWVILRGEDTSQTASSANTFLTAKTLPSDFRSWYSNSPIVLADANNNPYYYQEIPIAQKLGYKDTSYKFYTDYSAGSFYLCGPLTQSFTIHQFYNKKSTLVSAASDNTWAFPSEYSKILALDVAVMWRLGVDYDQVNARNADANAGLAEAIYNEMTRWDSRLQNSMTAGLDPFNPSLGMWQSGQMPMNN